MERGVGLGDPPAACLSFFVNAWRRTGRSSISGSGLVASARFPPARSTTRTRWPPKRGRGERLPLHCRCRLSGHGGGRWWRTSSRRGNL